MIWNVWIRMYELTILSRTAYMGEYIMDYMYLYSTLTLQLDKVFVWFTIISTSM